MRWWRKDEPHRDVFDLDARLGRLTANRTALDVYHACLYDDPELGTLMSGLTAQGEYTPQTMTTNIVKRQIDTYVERQEKNQPVPMALSVDGTYEERERAKDLSKLFSGLLDSVEYHASLTMRRRDRALWGTGICHNFRIGRKLFHDRAFPWEFRVDPREAQYGKPRTLIRRRWIDRLVLAEWFPDHEAEIMADNYEPTDDANIFKFDADDTNDLVFVIEIWHLPNGEPTNKDPKDGAHAICISNATLSNRVYKRDYFPFSITRFSEPVAGFWGEGLAANLRGLQFEVNAIGLRLQEQAWLTGTYVWTRSGDGLEFPEIDNGTLTHVQSDTQPMFFQPQPWNSAFWEYYMFLRGRAPAEETRQSEMGTRGELPSGLDSGRAIRSWNQLDDQAYLSHGKKDERDAVNTCWQLFDLCEEIYDEEKSAKPKKGEKLDAFSVETEMQEHGHTVIKSLDYAEVRMDRKKFKLRVYPTSLLSGTPAEQYQTAKEIANDGLLSRDAVMDLLRLPDVEAALRLETAPRRAVEKILSKLLRSKDPEGDYVYPEPAFNLQLCRALGLLYYLDGFTNDVPEENLFWVLQFSLDAEEQLERPDQEAAAAGGQPSPDGADVPPDPNAIGQDPSLFAPPQQPILPQGAAPPQAMPLQPQV